LSGGKAKGKQQVKSSLFKVQSFEGSYQDSVVGYQDSVVRYQGKRQKIG